MVTKAFIDLNIDGRIKVTTPYTPDFVDDLKNAVPSSYREWVKHLRAWLVDKHYLSDVEAICKQHFDEVHVDTTQSYPTFTSNETEECYACLFLHPSAPTWLVEKVWKLLAMEYHPDRNKDGAKKMVEVNEAYQKIKEERS